MDFIYHFFKNFETQTPIARGHETHLSCELSVGKFLNNATPLLATIPFVYRNSFRVGEYVEISAMFFEFAMILPWCRDISNLGHIV